MGKKTKFIIFLLGCFSNLSAQQNPYEVYKQKWTNQPAPDFKAKTIENRVFYLSDFRGKVVLLNFWFTTCSGCKIEYPGLQILKNRFSSHQEVVFLSLATDSEEKLKTFLLKNPLNFTHIANAMTIAEVYGVLGYPTNLIIDKNGIIRHIKIGGSAQSADDIEYEMKLLLK